MEFLTPPPIRRLSRGRGSAGTVARTARPCLPAANGCRRVIALRRHGGRRRPRRARRPGAGHRPHAGRRTSRSPTAASRPSTSVSLPIRQGEVLALIGPSGCGKTTLLRSLNRLTELNRDVTIDRTASRWTRSTSREL